MKHSRILLLAIALSSPALGSIIDTIQNGGFESGLTDWTSQFRSFNSLTGTCNDEFAAQTTGAGCATSATSPDGTMAAYSSSTIGTGNTEYIDDLSQSFVVPVAFTAAEIDFAETFTLTGTKPGGALIVQLYSGTTAINNAFFIANDFPVGFNMDISSPWTNETWDVTSILAAFAGQTVTLDLRTDAFGQGTAVTMAGAFDNVGADFTVTPEPSTSGLALAGVAALISRFRRKSENH